MSRLQTTLFLAGVFLTACGDDGVMPPPGSGAPDTAVTAFMGALPDWNSFSPLGTDAAPAPIGSPPDVLPDTVVADTIADDGSTRLPIPPVTYSCTDTEYSMASTPTEIVMYSPDTDILWPGALIQGKSYADPNPLGTLLGLTVSQRTPLTVSTDLPGGNNFRIIDNPNQANVSAAISEMAGNATTANLPSGSDIRYIEETAYSRSQFALSAKLSGRYLGFQGAASGSYQHTANKTTVSVHFIEKMFTASVPPPQTPDAFFSEAFTGDVLQRQINEGNIAPDNIPVYVSKVVYGRMMIYNFTSTASETDIKAAIDAAYKTGLANVEVNLRSKYEKILQTAEVTVQTLGGPSQAALDLIRTGNRSAFFVDAAPLSTARPLSYEFRGLSNGNPVAKVTEATDFTIRECTARASTPGTFNLGPVQVLANAPFVADSVLVADVDADADDDLIFNELGASNRFFVAHSQLGTFTQDSVITHPDSPSEGWANFTVSTADLNGDGRADLVWNHLGATNTTYTAVAQPNGTYAFPSPLVRVGGWGAFTVQIGDVNADGYDDLVWTHSSGDRIYVATSDANAVLQILPFQDHPNGGASDQWLLGDIDGVPGTDIVFNPRTTASQQLYTATTGGAGVFNLNTSNNTYSTGTDWNQYTAYIGDVNNQNGDDIISFWPGNGTSLMTVVHVRTSNGSGGFNTGVAPVTPFSNPSDEANTGPFQVHVGDFNGDNRADLFWNTLSSVNRGFVGLGLADGTLNFSPQRQLHPETENWSLFAVHLGDVNGDNRDDVIWVSNAVDIRIYTGLGQP